MTDDSLRNVDTHKAAGKVLAVPLDRLPMLISDRALANSRSSLSSLADLTARPSARISSETITMPKKKFGHRPILIPDTPARVLFSALVDSMDKELEPDSRAEGAWESHKSFAEDSASEYVVDIDIAACYEFIDHERLHEEILMRTMDVAKADAVRSFLSRCSLKRGIPQLSAPSDRLADLYLSVLQRQLMRHKFEVSRYADDFRVRASTWESAHDVIEYAAEYARSLGLILSSDKTRIVRTDAFRAKVQAQEDLRKTYFESAKASLTLTQMVHNRYTDAILVEIPPDDQKALVASMQRMLQDWRRIADGSSPDSKTGQESLLRGLLPIAITALQQEAERVEAEFFISLIYRDPIRLERMCKYILGRLSLYNEAAEDWSLLRKVISSGRIGPWARIWLLHVAGQLQDANSEDSAWVIDWASRQCTDRHETVRAEAAWTSAKFGKLTDDLTVMLLKAATSLTQHGIAAAMGRQGNLNSTLVKSVKQERVPINREAYGWGESN
ncbi:reverse transcriptase domain-containing protein [Streptomyces sp. NPDC057193]|uniref:reverse transcriptase domain-containing protein n=1 Tax=Streptomyces sp. NPDC057193 TaxID=3346043 RepID=UPI0036417E88